MLGVTKIKVMNLTPACLMPILICRLADAASLLG